MNKKLGIGIVVVAIVAVAMFTGCIEKEKVEINDFQIKDSEGTPVVEVNISGNTDVDIALLKEMSEITCEHVAARQLEDGREIVQLKMTDAYETPEGGNYSIEIYHEDKRIANESFKCVGALLSITAFEPSFEKYTTLKKRVMDEMTISYENIGDLPVYVSEIYFESKKGDTNHKKVAENSQLIEPGEEVTLSGGTYLEVVYYEYFNENGIKKRIADPEITIALLDSNGDLLCVPRIWDEFLW
jgi:hypothetical protein